MGALEADVGALLTVVGAFEADVGAFETCVGAFDADDGATLLTSDGAELFGFTVVALETAVGALEDIALGLTDPTLEMLDGRLP